jgi:hypothetical protein
VTSKRTVSLAEASAALQGRLLWNGEAVRGLPLRGAVEHEIVTGYGESSGVPFSHSTGIVLLYGAPSADYVLLQESRRPEMLYGFRSDREPPAGRVLVSSSEVLASKGAGTRAVPTGRFVWRGVLVQDGVYVGIEASSRSLLLDAARQLKGHR